MKRYAVVFSLCALWSALSVCRTLEKSLQVSVMEERVDGILFSHRIDTLDGIVTQRWLIDGHEVDERDYERRLAKADVRERKRERIKQTERARNHHTRVSDVQRSLLRRNLQDSIDEVKHALESVSDYRLRAYLVFDESTIDSLYKLDYLHNTLLPEAEELVASRTASLRDMQTMVTQLNEYPERLEGLFCQSVEHACETSDDTRLLKDLLNVMCTE